MCIIIVKPAGVKIPDYSTICKCATNNPDGFGFAVPKKKPFKTLDFDKFANKLYECSDDEPMIIHFRRATHGTIKPTNCHPFRDDYVGVSFAHNGILQVKPIGDKTDSETAFRILLIPNAIWFGIFTKDFDNAVKSIIGYSKFAFLTDKGQLKTYGDFIKHKGCLYSNQSFMW